MDINRRQAFHDIVRNRPVDVPYLVAAWQHLIGHEYGAKEFAAAYTDFVKHWDWEWVKINPRAVYYAEAWGSRYDKDDYAGFVLPRKLKSAIETPADLAKVTRLNPRENAYFAEALEAAGLIRNALEDRAALQTVFSPLSVLLQIADLPLYPGDDYATPTLTRDELVFDHAEEAKAALDAIAHTLADYATALVTSKENGGVGLDGVFYAVTGMVSEDYFDQKQYAEFGEPYDRIVLDAIKAANPDAVVLLHTCRAESHPDRFAADYAGDIAVLQWDQYLQGNPQIDAPFDVVPVGGPSYQDFALDGDADTVRADINEVKRLRSGKPFLLAPSCTVPTPASEASLAALSGARAER